MRQCYFCTNNVKEIDYKNEEVLKKFLDPHSRLMKRSRTDLCAKHQRQLATAVKRARFMALLPFMSE